MSKKAKKGGKKGGKKAAVQEEKVELTEVDKELFQIQISDLMRKVERLKNRCRELETSNEDYQQRYNQLDEDRADIIAYLKRDLQQKTDEITELEERLVGLQKSKDADTAMFLERIAQFEKNYKLMHEQLTSEIKLLSGKLNSLEEFRIQREELTKKYKNQEERMAEQEILHQQAMYDVEKKFIIGKDKLKKEMEAKLLQLSTDFRDAMQLRIAATTHRAIRENIALSNEYNQMLEESRVLMNENANLKDLTYELRLEAQLFEEEKNTAIADSKVQLRLLEKMSEDHERMAARVAGLQGELSRCEEAKEELCELRATLQERDESIQSLCVLLGAAREQQCEASAQLTACREHAERLRELIQSSISTIKNALLIQEDPFHDEAQVLACRENVLGTLLQLLDSAPKPPKPPKLDIEVAPTTEDLMADYVTGDLSLVSPAAPPCTSQLQDVRPDTDTDTDTPEHVVASADYNAMAQEELETADGSFSTDSENDESHDIDQEKSEPF
ncbi:cilia- and flagella-associated protein 157 isoform X2 [Bacillus rossius redtenbacheri]|uniref:cilia- and flagella-associated protein 157 isoform X2 n=1 Tax=Bacillus rossius redtenbacheri TaxID=93214 RepID=UPI002FDCB78F